MHASYVVVAMKCARCVGWSSEAFNSAAAALNSSHIDAARSMLRNGNINSILRLLCICLNWGQGKLVTLVKGGFNRLKRRRSDGSAVT